MRMIEIMNCSIGNRFAISGLNTDSEGNLDVTVDDADVGSVALTSILNSNECVTIFDYATTSDGNHSVSLEWTSTGVNQTVILSSVQ